MYTVDSSFIGVLGPLGAGLWEWEIQQHNREESAEIVALYQNLCMPVNLNRDLVLAQACHETGWFTSDRWRRQRNPAGLGVTSDDAPGPTFANREAGIKAHLEHLCCYVLSEDPPIIAEWGMLDPRHTFHDGRPAVRDLVRPDRSWAVPGDGYAAAIVAIANQVAGKGAGEMVTLPSSTDIGYAVRWHAAADVGPARALADIRWFVVHDTEGHMLGDESVLTSSAPPVESAHALIDRDGLLVMMVPLEATAWTPGNDDVARASINVELSGFATSGYTDDQIRSLAAFFRWCVARGCAIPAVYIGRVDADGGPLPDAGGIVGHEDVPDPDHPGQWGGVAHHTDPGPLFPWARFVGLCAGDVHPTQAPSFAAGNPLGEIPMLHPFSSRYFALDATGLALPMMGYPEVAEQTLATGRRVQRFERGWYGTQAASDPWDLVQMPPEEVAALGLPG